MTAPIFNQCLLFTIHKAKQETRNTRCFANQPIYKGFLLLPSSFRSKCPKICELFLQNELLVIDSNHHFPCHENDKVELIELFLSGSFPNHLIIYASGYHREVVSLIFSPNIPVCFVSGFTRTSRFQSALDQEGLNFIKQLLTCKADICHGHKKAGSLLHFAIKREDEILIKFLLENKLNVNAQRIDGSTPLHIASKKKALMPNAKSQILQLLIENGANVNSKMSDGMTALHIATDKGHLQAVKCLLQNGANIESRILSGANQRGCTSLHISIKRRYGAIAKLLLKMGANVNAECYDGVSCLQLAVDIGDVDIILCVLKHRPDVNNNSNRRGFLTAICKIDASFNKIVETMFQVGFTINPEDAMKSGVLCGAVKLSRVDIVQILLENGADTNEAVSFQNSSLTPLHLAAAYTGKNIIKLLLSFGADINTKSDQNITPLRMAVQNNKAENVKFLVENGASVLEDLGVAYIAVDKNYPEILEIIMQNGGDPHFQDNSLSRYTLLAIAASEGFLRVIEVLLLYGSRIPFLPRYEEFSALLVAFDRQKLQALEILLDYEFTDSSFISEDEIRFTFEYLFSEYDEEYVEFLELCIKTFARHLLKMDAANFITFDINMLTVLERCADVSETWLRESLGKYEAEIGSLKNEHVGNSYLTYYDLLRCSISRIACLLRNDSIMQTVMLEDYKRKFPNYAGIINWQLKRGFHRKHLLEKSFKLCRVPSNKLNALPVEMVHKILDYLSDRELIICTISWSIGNSYS